MVLTVNNATTSQLSSPIGAIGPAGSKSQSITAVQLERMAADLTAMAAKGHITYTIAGDPTLDDKVEVSTLDNAGSATIDGKIDTHNADTTAVHGIADTSVLATATSVATAVTTHTADTTAVHGIADTSKLLDDSNVATVVAAPSAITAFTAPVVGGLVPVVSTAATDLDDVAAALKTLRDEVAALKTTVEDALAALKAAGLMASA